MVMEIYMMENGLMIKLKDMEYIFILMDQNIMVNGKKINRMGKAWKLGKMALPIKEII